MRRIFHGRFRFPLGLAPVIALCLLAVVGPVRAQNYNAVILDNVAGTNWSVATGISANMVVGYGWGPAWDGPRTPVYWDVSIPTNPETNLADPAQITAGAAFGAAAFLGEFAGSAVGPATGNALHAVLFDEFGFKTDLHPAVGFDWTEAVATSGDDQVGFGVGWLTGGQWAHALRWRRTAASVQDLHPTGANSLWSNTQAMGTDSAQVVGFGSESVRWGGVDRALLWDHFGTMTELLIPNLDYDASRALAVHAGTQVGWAAVAFSGGDRHAVQWNSTEASMIDLHPAGFSTSEARATHAFGHAGFGRSGSGWNHALFWRNGVATDLHNFLPTGYVGSEANGIESGGNVVGTAWMSNGTQNAVLWRRILAFSGFRFKGSSTIRMEEWIRLRVQFDGPTFGDGAFVDLSSSNQEVLPLPSRVYVKPGEEGADITVQAKAVKSKTTVRLEARYGKVAKAVSITVIP